MPTRRGAALVAGLVVEQPGRGVAQGHLVGGEVKVHGGAVYGHP